jgi:ABC transport system ATP-binding/permease protein
MLSGGERNRMLLARLFARPANLVVLDEPTNDLDIESLELLEQKLQDYTGTLLLVSHDRRFLDNVVTQTVAAEGGGQWHEYVGGYTDWLQQRRTPTTSGKAAGAKRTAGAAGPSRAPIAGASATGGTSDAGMATGNGGPASAGLNSGSSPASGQAVMKPKAKLSYKDQRELATLPDEIEALEREQSELNALMSSPDYHRRGPDKIREDRLRSEQIETLLMSKFERWEALEQARPR